MDNAVAQDTGSAGERRVAANSDADIVMGRLLSAACWNACFADHKRTFLVPFTVASRQLRIIHNVASSPFDDSSINRENFAAGSHERWTAIVNRTLRARSVMALTTSDALDFQVIRLYWQDVIDRVPSLAEFIRDRDGWVPVTVVGLSKAMASVSMRGHLSAFLAGMVAGQLASLSAESLRTAYEGKHFGGVLHFSELEVKPVNMLMAVPSQTYDAWHYYDGMLFWIGKELTEAEVFGVDSQLQLWLESSRRWATMKTGPSSTAIQSSIDRAREGND